MSSIILKDVCLDYVIKTGSDSIKKTAVTLCQHMLGSKSQSPASVRNSSYRALNNINLTLQKGDRVGLLGRNGAGKSTLLRVMAKVYKPNAGIVEINGQISTLFDVNLGLDPEATGYENIVNLGIIRGYTKKQASSVIEDVERFTELGDFLYAPVRTYSSGMQMKLSFAVVTAFPPEIMLIDEVIGVGDAQFMKKATQRIESVIENSHVLVLTSHSVDIVKKFCNKVLVLDGGEVQFFGDSNEAVVFG